MAAAALLMALPALFQMGMGAYQTIKGEKMIKEDTPPYQISPSLLKMRDIQRGYAQGEMPGIKAMTQAQRTNTANQMDAMAKYGVSDPNIISRIGGQERDALGQIGLASADYRTGEKDKYLNVLGGVAQEEASALNWDILQPFERKMASGGAMAGSGFQNLYGATTSLADRAGTKEMLRTMYPETYQEEPSWFTDWFGKMGLFGGGKVKGNGKYSASDLYAGMDYQEAWTV